MGAATERLNKALSVLFPGLGQIYNREIERGIAFMAGFFVATLSAIVLVGFVLAPAVWLYSIYDAYVHAQRQADSTGSDGGIGEQHHR